MKKIAIAAAIAALSAPVFAQSSVTLWGRINTSVESIKTGNNDRVASVITTTPVWASRVRKTWVAA